METKNKYFYLAQKNDSIFSLKIPEVLHNEIKSTAEAQGKKTAEFIRECLADIVVKYADSDNK